MILTAPLASRAPSVESRGGKRAEAAGVDFHAVLGASDPAVRSVPTGPKPKGETSRPATEKEIEPDEAPPADGTTAPINGLALFDASRPERLDWMPSLAPKTPPASLGALVLDGLGESFDQLDVRVAVTRLTASEVAARMVTQLPPEAAPSAAKAFELPPAPADSAGRPVEAEAAGERTSAGERAAVDSREQQISEHGSSESGNADRGSSERGSSENDSSGEPNAFVSESGAASLNATPAATPQFAVAAGSVPEEEVGALLTAVADRVVAAAMTLDAQVGIEGGITVHLDDALGRWEVDVIRQGTDLTLVLRGDANLHDAVRQGAGELRERLARDGISLTQLQFQPHERGDGNRTAVTATHQANGSGFGHPSGEGAARREDAPPLPAPRAPRKANVRATAPATTHPRRGLDVAV